MKTASLVCASLLFAGCATQHSLDGWMAELEAMSHVNTSASCEAMAVFDIKLQPDGMVAVGVTNVSHKAVAFSGASYSRPQLFIGSPDPSGGYIHDSWDWCGTGLRRLQLGPGRAVYWHINPRPGHRYATILHCVDRSEEDVLFWFYSDPREADPTNRAPAFSYADVAPSQYDTPTKQSLSAGTAQ